MANMSFETCKVRDFDGQYFPRTLSGDNLPISPNILWPYTWVKVENPGDYAGADGDILCIFIDDEWHQAQSIDFDFE